MSSTSLRPAACPRVCGLGGSEPQPRGYPAGPAPRASGLCQYKGQKAPIKQGTIAPAAGLCWDSLSGAAASGRWGWDPALSGRGACWGGGCLRASVLAQPRGECLPGGEGAVRASELSVPLRPGCQAPGRGKNPGSIKAVRRQSKEREAPSGPGTAACAGPGDATAPRGHTWAVSSTLHLEKKKRKSPLPPSPETSRSREPGVRLQGPNVHPPASLAGAAGAEELLPLT